MSPFCPMDSLKSLNASVPFTMQLLSLQMSDARMHYATFRYLFVKRCAQGAKSSSIAVLSTILSHTDSIRKVQLNLRGSRALHSRNWLLLIWMDSCVLPQQRESNGFAGIIEVVVNDVILVLRNTTLDVLLNTQIRCTWWITILSHPQNCILCTFHSTLLLSHFSNSNCKMQRKRATGEGGRRGWLFSFGSLWCLESENLVVVECSTHSPLHWHSFQSILHSSAFRSVNPWFEKSTSNQVRIRHKTLFQLLSRGITAFQHHDGKHDSSN